MTGPSVFRSACALALTAAGCSAGTPLPSVERPPAHDLTAGPWVVDFQDGIRLDTARSVLGDSDADWFHPKAADDGIMVVSSLPSNVRDRLRVDDRVEAFEPSLEYTALGFPDDPLRDQQWNFDVVGAAEGWRLGGGSGVVVAVIDTGVTQVADLMGTPVLEGVSFVSGEDTARDGNGHGTHVAGTIAQTTNNGIGVAGVAPGATILPIKALSATGGGRSEWVAAAIDEAGDQGAQIINLSLGGPPSAVISNAVQKAQNRGLLVIAAAGNTGQEGVGSPARLPGVIAVSATGPSDLRAPYSTFGPEVTLSAPGGDKTLPGGGILQDTVSKSAADGHAFLELQGTSMATPHVSGAAAVLWGATAGGAEHVRNLLVSSARDLGDPGHDPIFGHGRLDIAAAVRAVALRERGLSFLLAGVLSWLLAGMAGTSRRRSLTALVAACTAGGLFFLPLLPLPPSSWMALLERPLLLWVDVVIGQGWARSPLILSAALPVTLTFFFGPSRRLGFVAAGISAGIGTHLLFGAVSGCLSPTWIPSLLAPIWLMANGLLSLGSAAAAFGVQVHQESAGARS